MVDVSALRTQIALPSWNRHWEDIKLYIMTVLRSPVGCGSSQTNHLTHLPTPLTLRPTRLGALGLQETDDDAPLRGP